MYLIKEQVDLACIQPDRKALQERNVVFGELLVVLIHVEGYHLGDNRLCKDVAEPQLVLEVDQHQRECFDYHHSVVLHKSFEEVHAVIFAEVAT